MTTLFRASNWISESKDSIVSRGVTTCAGMTAHTIVLAQTRVGFVTGDRKKSFLDLPQDEQTVQPWSFFLLAAAWVDPGRNALQSAEQWRKGRYGRMHQVVKCHFMTKTCKKAV